MLFMVSNLIEMLNDLLLISCIWIDEIVFRNDMIISFKVRINLKKTTIHLLISLSFILTPFLLYFSPTRRLHVHQIDTTIANIFLSLDHVMVEDINDFC